MSAVGFDAKNYFGITSNTTTKKSNSDMNMEDFLRLMVAQLENQNPLEPMKDADFYAQLAQLGQVQGMDKLISSSDLEKANNLVGKEVTAVRTMTETGNSKEQLVTGTVRKVTIKDGVYYLGVEEANGGIAEVKLDNLQTVSPSAKSADYAYLIGKSVSGLANVTTNGLKESVAAIGTVVGVSDVDGVIMAQVQTKDKGVLAVAIENIEHVSQ